MGNNTRAMVNSDRPSAIAVDNGNRPVLLSCAVFEKKEVILGNHFFQKKNNSENHFCSHLLAQGSCKHLVRSSVARSQPWWASGPQWRSEGPRQSCLQQQRRRVAKATTTRLLWCELTSCQDSEGKHQVTKSHRGHSSHNSHKGHNSNNNNSMLSKEQRRP